MAVNETEIDAPPAAVWAVLADAHAYGLWVVGSREVRSAEPHWPDPGAIFHHSQGAGPVTLLKDTTAVIERDPGRRLLLEVRARPWVIGHVDLTLEPSGEGTRVRMVERPVGGWIARIDNPLVDLGIKTRNTESLRRLKRLAERRARAAPVATSAA